MLNYYCCCSLSQSCLTFEIPWTAARQASWSLTQSLPKFMFIASVMPSSRLILWCFLFLLPSIFPSIRDFSSESSVHIRWPKDWRFSFIISPSNEYSWLVSFKIDWFDLLAFQGTLKSLLYHHRSKTSILWCSAIFIVQLSHSYITTGKDSLDYTDLCQQSNVSAFNTLSRFATTFLLISNCLLISWLQLPSTVILES